jgi:serine/threonine protein kinase
MNKQTNNSLLPVLFVHHDSKKETFRDSTTKTVRWSSLRRTLEEVRPPRHYFKNIGLRRYNQPPSMALVAGTNLGPYEIQSLLGAGGMGEVYRARDVRLQRTVAIKILPTHLSSNPNLQARFEQEAKSISALQHANICVVHGLSNRWPAPARCD